MKKISLEKYLGKKVRITFLNNDTVIGLFDRAKDFTPGTGYCKPLLYEIWINDGMTKCFRPSDVKKCQEVEKNG